MVVHNKKNIYMRKEPEGGICCSELEFVDAREASSDEELIVGRTEEKG